MVKLGYARVSTDKQEIENQVRELKKCGISPKDVYTDVGVSGITPAKKRKGFKKAYDRIIKGEVDELYIFELSRLGRNARESLLLFLEIEQAGCKIISLSKNEEWTRVDLPGIREVFLAIFAWFADLERKANSERTKLSLERARKEGTKSGKPIGRPSREPDRKKYNEFSAQGLKPGQIAVLMRVPTATMYRWINKWNEADRIKENEEIMK